MYLDLIRHYRARTKRCTDLVRADSVKITETDINYLSFRLQVLHVSQGGDIPLVIVILPVKLEKCRSMSPDTSMIHDHHTCSRSTA